MELYSAQFILFIAIGIVIHEISLRLCERYQWIVRLLVSLIYYLMMSQKSVIFIIVSSLWFYYGARWICDISAWAKVSVKNAPTDKKSIKREALFKKRLVLYSIITFNLLLLAGAKILMPHCGENIIVPVGISFYTFMGISYLVDVYGGKHDYESNYFKLLLFLVWFPQLLQGPINRYDEQKKSLYAGSAITWYTAKCALFLILFGALKKYAIANPLAFPVERVFDGDLSQKPGAYLLLGAFMFAIQQYADFSGGIDMVMGVSMLFGVSMSSNFRQPYFSKTVGEFWRRWHISLGAFMRDYVFYPFLLLKPIQKLMNKLNSRLGTRASRSLIGGMGNLLVFVLVGAWHGLKLHYILWGLYNGLIIALSDGLNPFFSKLKAVLHINDKSRIYGAFAILRTFIIIVLAGFFDRVADVRQGIICFKNLILHFEYDLTKIWVRTLYEWEAFTEMKLHLIVASCLIVIANSIICERNENSCLFHVLENRCVAVRWGVIYIMMILVMSSFIFTQGNIGFMYEQF